MADISYQQARRLALKEVRARTAQHLEPNLTVLEELVPHMSALPEEELGSFRLDIEQIAGTRTASRKTDFSASFYPLLEENSEFAAKWSALAASHLKEGIREPIKAVEYLNRFYVVEGHKRVSVLRFFGAPTVRAEVRRLLPVKSDAPEIAAYYEFLDFYRVTRVNFIRFSVPGKYPELLSLLRGKELSAWDEDAQRGFYSEVIRFRRAFRATELTGALTQDEALLRYLKIFGYEHLEERSSQELLADLKAIAPELMGVNHQERLLKTDPAPAPRSILQKLVHPPAKNLKVAFLHDKDPETSFWTACHEEGRRELEKTMGDRVQTVSFFNMLREDVETEAEALSQEHYDVVFTTTPRLMDAALTAAGHHPDIKFLNCSPNGSHPLLRCYYGRMYEAKFLTGVIAGAMSENGSIGYICDYPIYTAPASINAFALGARMVDPRCRITLQWSSVPQDNIGLRFAQNGVTAASGQEDLNPAEDADRGVFCFQKGVRKNLGCSYWNWGEFYRRILESILDGSWAGDTAESDAGKTINYWWGIQSGVVDVRFGDGLPPATRRLVELLRRGIMERTVQPFAGPIYDQNGHLRVAAGEEPGPWDIMNMDWLCDNVDGEIPQPEKLNREARELVKLQGVKK